MHARQFTSDVVDQAERRPIADEVYRRPTLIYLRHALLGLGILASLLTLVLIGGRLPVWVVIPLFAYCGLALGAIATMGPKGHAVKITLQSSAIIIHSTPSISYALSDLDALAITPSKRAKRDNGTVVYCAPQMHLVFENPQRYVHLRKPSITRLRNEQPPDEEFETWYRLCREIETVAFPKALAERWRRASAYKRYQMLISRLELVVLRNPSTPFRMLIETLRIFKNMGAGLTYAIIRGFFLYLGVCLVFLAVDRTMGPPEFLKGQMWNLIMLAMIVVALLYTLHFWFRPLSHRLRDESEIELVAAHLMNARLLRDDFRPVVEFLRIDGSRVEAQARLLQLVTIVSAALSLWLDFDLLLKATVVSVLGAVFVIANLYYSTIARLIYLGHKVMIAVMATAPLGESGALTDCKAHETAVKSS